MYNARVFINTGFNAVNVPYSKTIVTSAATSYFDVTGLTIVQERFLGDLKIPTTWNAIKDADYIMLWDETQTIAESWCYFITGVAMQAADVAQVAVVQDFLTSFGGPGALTIIDGITRRSTYALDNVAGNLLATIDEYLAPSEPMQLLTEWIGEGTTGDVYLESTLDVVETAQVDEAETAASSGGYNVTYPVPVYVTPGKYTDFVLNDNESKSVKSAGSMIVCPDATGIAGSDEQHTTIEKNFVRQKIALGLAKIRGMGLEGSILNQVWIPGKYAVADTFVSVWEDDEEAGEPYVQYWVQSMLGKWTEVQTSINMRQLSTSARENDVLNFSHYAFYGIMSASGETLEADPKDLMTTANPYIKMVGDPRLDGKPYFRFKYINNNIANNSEFFRNAISGLPWRNVPLVFTQKSGNALNTAQHNASRYVQNTAFSAQRKEAALSFQNAQSMAGAELISGAVTGLLGGGITGLSNSFSIEQQKNPGINAETIGRLGMISTGISLGTQLARQYTQMKNAESEFTLARQNAIENFQAAKLADMVSYGIETEVVLPEVMFPYSTETLRDFYGNGVLVYRFWYGSHDVTRLQRILRAYGAKYDVKTIAAHFQPSGRDYCYVEASGVSVGGLPQWASNAIAAQIANGVRIWNTRPHNIS